MIVLISGSINSGKSTTAKIVAARLGNTAVVEVDKLREFIEWMPLEESIPINLENAVSVTRNFRRLGLNVVVPYPLSENNYEYLTNELKEYIGEIKAFTLDPTLPVALSKRGSRDLTDWEKERIKHHYAIGIHRPSFGMVLDNSKETPEETSRQILKLLA
jgi:hypothetical protein